jgi:hypothetical protein
MMQISPPGDKLARLMNPDEPSQSGGPPAGPPDGAAFTQQFNHQPVGARIPERVARGAFTTGVIILDSPKEFVLDFLQGLSRPFQVVSRVIMTPATFEELHNALRDNLNKYAEAFGPIPPLPKPPNPARPSIQEIYETFKVPEELHSGNYANTVLIGHTPAEMFMDFITGFYPTAAVSSRVFMAVTQAPRILETVTMALTQYNQRYRGGR